MTPTTQWRFTPGQAAKLQAFAQRDNNKFAALAEAGFSGVLHPAHAAEIYDALETAYYADPNDTDARQAAWHQVYDLIEFVTVEAKGGLSINFELAEARYQAKQGKK